MNDQELQTTLASDPELKTLLAALRGLHNQLIVAELTDNSGLHERMIAAELTDKTDKVAALRQQCDEVAKQFRSRIDECAAIERTQQQRSPGEVLRPLEPLRRALLAGSKPRCDSIKPLDDAQADRWLPYPPTAPARILEALAHVRCTEARDPTPTTGA